MYWCVRCGRSPVIPYNSYLLQASVKRLTRQPFKSELEEERQKPRWIQQTLQRGRWVDSERPWRRIGTAETCKKCVEMHDRYTFKPRYQLLYMRLLLTTAQRENLCRAAEDQKAKMERLLEKYCQPLVKSSGNEKHNKKLVQQFCGRPHIPNQSPFRTSTGRA